MITPQMYLKDIFLMSEAEKQQLLDRLDRIESETCTMDYILVTLSALSQTHGFIDMAHRLDEQRVQDEICGFVKLMRQYLPERATLVSQTTDQAGAATPGARESHDTKSLGEKQHAQPTLSTAQKKTGLDASKVIQQAVGGDRPNHFDEWRDHMSDALRAKIDQLKDLHTKKVYYRQEVERLSVDTNHSKQDLSRAATLCANYEKKILAIYQLADIEWNELQGRKVSQDAKDLVKREEMDADKVIGSQGAARSETSKRSKKENKDGETKAESKEGKAKAESKEGKAKAEADNESGPEPICADGLSDKELEQLTVLEILHSNMAEGPRRFYVSRRVNNARKYLAKIGEQASDAQKVRCKEYLKDLSDAGSSVNPKVRVIMEKLGLM